MPSKEWPRTDEHGFVSRYQVTVVERLPDGSREVLWTLFGESLKLDATKDEVRLCLSESLDGD